MDLTIRKRGKFFAVHEGEALVCICVYRKGAEAVIARLRKGVA